MEENVIGETNVNTNTNQNDYNNNNNLNRETLVMIPDPSSVILEISKKGKKHKILFFTNIFNNSSIKSDCLSKYSWKKEGNSILFSKNSYLTLKEKQILKCLNFQQITKDIRRNYWLTITGAKREISNNPTYYSDLTTYYPDYIPNPNAKQIELDIHRTFPEENFYTNEENLRQIERICNAYGKRCYSIGYSQGFNQMVGRILEVVKNEEEAFWIFTQLVEQCLPCGFFCELAEMLTYYKLVSSILEENFSGMYEHLQKNGIDLYFNNTIYKWLLSLFIQNLHKDMQMIIWDMLLLEGTVVLFKSIIALVSIFEHDIMNISSLEEANVFFDTTIARKPTRREIEKLQKYLVLKLYNFNEEELRIQKNKILPETIEEIKASGKYLLFKAYHQNISCDLDWPLCIYDYKYREDITDYFVYSKLNGINIKDNYLDEYEYKSKVKKDKENKKNEVIKEERYVNVLMQRRQHCCNSDVKTISNIVDKINSGENINYNSLLQQRKEIFDKYSQGKEVKKEDFIKKENVI